MMQYYIMLILVVATAQLVDGFTSPPSNKCRNIQMSKKNTYGNIADCGKRPRGCFDTIFKPQLKQDCKLIFDGHISKLDNSC